MPIFHGLLCSAEQLKQIRELTDQVAQPLPSTESGADLSSFLQERQNAKDQLRGLLASLRPPTVEDLAAEIEQLQNKIETLQTKLEAKITEGGRARREKRPS
jgi:chromosome segregation ATPase